MGTDASRLALLSLALTTPWLVGGTCAEPPPWRDVSGDWVNASTGPEALLGSDPDTARDLDLVLSIAAAVPTDRTPLPVSGAVCLVDRSGTGAAGTYTLEPTRSTWAGADYGGARLDLEARASDGRVVRIAQAHMANASPDQLDNAIITWVAADGATTLVFPFEGLRRTAAASCPPAP